MFTLKPLSILTVLMLCSLLLTGCSGGCEPDMYSIMVGTYDTFKIYDPDIEDYIFVSDWVNKYFAFDLNKASRSYTRQYYSTCKITFYENGFWEITFSVKALRGHLEHMEFLALNVTFRGEYSLSRHNYYLTISNLDNPNGVETTGLSRFMERYSAGSLHIDHPCLAPHVERIGPFEVY